MGQKLPRYALVGFGPCRPGAAAKAPVAIVEQAARIGLVTDPGTENVCEAAVEGVNCYWSTEEDKPYKQMGPDGWPRCRKLVSSSQAKTDPKEKKGSPNTAYRVHSARGCWLGFGRVGEWSADLSASTALAGGAPRRVGKRWATACH